MSEKKQLYKLYVTDGLTIREIARKIRVSASTVGRKLRGYGIETRNAGAPHYIKLDDKNWLYKQYVVKKLSTAEIGEKIGANGRTVNSWLQKHGIPRRKAGGQLKGKKMSIESRQKMSEAGKGKRLGPDNPNWQGGKTSPEIRERRSHIARKWRLSVLKRDKFTCQVCGSEKDLHVHHILSFAGFPDRRWDINNGVTLCVFCHEKAHNRQFPGWLTGRVSTPNESPELIEVAKKKKFDISKEELAKSYDDMSMREMSEFYGFHEETIRRWLKSYKIKTRKSGGRRIFQPPKDELNKYYQKYSMAKIAAIYGVGETVVFKRIKEYGITLKGFEDGGHRKKKGKKIKKQK